MEQTHTTFEDISALSRRQLVSGFTAAAAATAAVAAPGAAEAAAASAPIQRLAAAGTLQAPVNNGHGSYSQVVTSTRKKMIFVAGQLSRDNAGKAVAPGDPAGQMRQVCENLKTALAAVGATLADVVQTTTFTTDFTKFREAGEVRYEYFGKNLPTSTAIQIVALATPDCLFEVNAIAMVDA